MVSSTKVIRPNSLPVIPEREAGTLPQKHTQRQRFSWHTHNISLSFLNIRLTASEKTQSFLLEAGHMQAEDEIVVIRAACSTANVITCYLPSWWTTGMMHMLLIDSHVQCNSLTSGLQICAYMVLFYSINQNCIGKKWCLYVNGVLRWKHCLCRENKVYVTFSSWLSNISQDLHQSNT